MAIEIDGFEDLESMIQEMNLTEADEKKAMKLAIEPIADEVEKNTPESSGNMKKQIKTTVKKEGFATVGEVKMGSWYTGFEEFGTSQQKHHVGFFERSVNKTQDEAVSILARELLDKAK